MCCGMKGTILRKYRAAHRTSKIFFFWILDECIYHDKSVVSFLFWHIWSMTVLSFSTALTPAKIPRHCPRRKSKHTYPSWWMGKLKEKETMSASGSPLSSLIVQFILTLFLLSYFKHINFLYNRKKIL